MNVYQKISAVMKDVQYLAKDDRVKFGSTDYKAISEEKVTSVVRESLVKHGVVIIPTAQSHSREGTLSTVDVTYRIQNIDDVDDYVVAASSGTGADTQDKGVGKAMTYAYKYLLLRTFAIPTGEDPDKISSAELDDKQAKAKAKTEAKEKIKPTAADKPASESPQLATPEQMDELKNLAGEKDKDLNAEMSRLREDGKVTGKRYKLHDGTVVISLADYNALLDDISLPF